MIKLEGPNNTSFYVNPRMIVTVEDDQIRGLVKIVLVGDTMRYVVGTADEIAVKINNIL